MKCPSVFIWRQASHRVELQLRRFLSPQIRSQQKPLNVPGYALYIVPSTCFDLTCHSFINLEGGGLLDRRCWFNLEISVSFVWFLFFIDHFLDQHVAKPTKRDPNSIGKDSAPAARSPSEQTTADVHNGTLYMQQMYIFWLWEKATSWYIWLYGAIILLYFSRRTC